jgi:hypothetical protein
MDVISDPVLRAVKSQDESLHEQLLRQIADVDPKFAQAIAAYDELPASLMPQLAATAKETRIVLANRPDIAEDLLVTLAKDSEADVRRELARNSNCPLSMLHILAGDEDQWVRYAVFHNTNATDEIRAQVSLLSTPEELSENSSSYVPPIRARITEEAFPSLIRESRTGEEWGELWRHDRPQWPSSLWPSTLAFTSPNTPLQVLETLAAAGHPAALIHSKLNAPSEPVMSPESVMQLIDSELLIRALWRELAQEEVVQLHYWNNSDEGDRFFPDTPMSTDLMDPDSAAQVLVGGWSDDRDWIVREDQLSLDSFYRVAGMRFEELPGELEPDLMNTETLDVFATTGIAYAYYELNMNLSITPKGEEAMFALRDEFYFEHNDYETVVTVAEGRLPDISYANTSEQQKAALAQLLVESRIDHRLHYWGISSHFLKCLALHPKTPKDIREKLPFDPDPGVQHAGNIAEGDSQPGVPYHGQPTHAANINAFVSSILIPEHRFEEARIWLDQCMEIASGYELWNAISNLGIVAFLSGRTEEARTLFETVMASGDGPGLEAAEYIQRILSDERHPRTPDLKYTEDWRDYPLDVIPSPDDQQGLYLRGLRIFSESNMDDNLREAWILDRGSYSVGFLKVVLAAEGVMESGVTRETMARALRDYVERVVLAFAPENQACTQGTLDLAAGDQQRAEQLIRRAAVSGDSEAAAQLGAMLIDSGQDALGQAWINVAKGLAI